MKLFDRRAWVYSMATGDPPQRRPSISSGGGTFVTSCDSSAPPAVLQRSSTTTIGTAKNLTLAAEANSLASTDLGKLEQNLMTVVMSNHVRILDLFREWDLDKDGRVSRLEFRRALTNLGLEDAIRSEEGFRALWEKFDQDGSQSVDFFELQQVLESTRREAGRHSLARPGAPKSSDGAGPSKVLDYKLQGEAGAASGGLAAGSSGAAAGACGGVPGGVPGGGGGAARRRSTRPATASTYVESMRRGAAKRDADEAQRQESAHEAMAAAQAAWRKQDAEDRDERHNMCRVVAGKALEVASARPSLYLAPDVRAALYDGAAQARILPVRSPRSAYAHGLVAAGARNRKKYGARPPFAYPPHGPRPIRYDEVGHGPTAEGGPVPRAPAFVSDRPPPGFRPASSGAYKLHRCWADLPLPSPDLPPSSLVPSPRSVSPREMPERPPVLLWQGHVPVPPRDIESLPSTPRGDAMPSSAFGVGSPRSPRARPQSARTPVPKATARRGATTTPWLNQTPTQYPGFGSSSPRWLVLQLPVKCSLTAGSAV